MTRDIDISSPRADAFAPTDRSDPSYPKSLVDYCFQEFLVRDGQLLQVYEELLNIAYWIRGFAPHNVLEVGSEARPSSCCRGLPRAKRWRWTYATCAKLHHFMFGHEWCFFQGNSQAPEMQQAVSSYCDRFDLIFIDGDHRYEGVKRDFENFRPLLSKRGVILFHDVDPDHVFKGREGGDAWRFWRDLDEGSKTLLCCSRSNGAIEVMGQRCHFGGFGIWSPT